MCACEGERYFTLGPVLVVQVYCNKSSGLFDVNVRRNQESREFCCGWASDVTDVIGDIVLVGDFHNFSTCCRCTSRP